MASSPASPPTPSVPLADARRAAGRVLGRLSRDPSALRLAVTGDVRRMAPVVEGVAILATAHDPEALLTAFRELPFLEAVPARGVGVAMGTTQDDIPIALKVLPDDDTAFFTQLLWLTSRVDHWALLKARAEAAGLTLGFDALKRGEERLPVKGEADLYEHLGIPYVPPELREGPDLVAPPADLVEMHDVQGLVHVHTTDGEGTHSLVMMADRVRREGFTWMVLGDRELDTASMEAQRSQIEVAHAAAAEEESPFRVFHGGEARVGQDGSLDLGNEVLASLDLTFAAPAATVEAVVDALSHPAVKVLCHPRTLEAGAWSTSLGNWEPVLDACQENRVAVELSGAARASPLPEGWNEAVRERELTLLPCADARDLGGIEDVILAVGQARRGGWSREEVPVCLPAGIFANWLSETQD